MSQTLTLFIRYQRISRALFIALLTLILYWNLTRPSGFNWVVMSMQFLPLLALVPGLYSQHYRAYSWLCFMMLLYFIFAVQGAFASTANLSDYLFVLLCMSLFCSSMMCSRYAQRVQKNLD